MNSPQTERFLSSLKDFQRDTVDYAFRRMYEDECPATRFLIADEVGLGKTKVAAGIVARATDLLREEDPARRIDVIYICSNAGIAKQNIARLNVTGQPCHDLPDRITLLPRDISRLRGNSVNFIAFTPGTSLSIRSGTGRGDERALLYWLLPEDWRENDRGAVSILTGEMGKDRFKWRIDELPRRSRIDEELREAFRARVSSELLDPTDPASSLRGRFLALAEQLGGRASLRDEERKARNEIVGALRAALAGVCVESLEPDLVILDEFQRFSDLLHGTDEASQLAKQLFNYRAAEVRHGDVRVLLLSATPYRMFSTADDPDGSGHYEDLVQTVGFLQNDTERTAAFRAALAEYGKELFRIGVDEGNSLRAARDEIARMLRQVMVRTERLAVTADRSGMLKEVTASDVRVLPGDLNSFLMLQELARVVDVPEVTEYWKSSPYLLNFMDDYDLKRNFDEIVEAGRATSGIFEVLTGSDGSLLSREEVLAYRQLDPANARVRDLVTDMLDSDAWRLLWIPPAWPYYSPDGVFALPIAEKLTKRLIFSAWQVVPKVVAALLSHEAERRMLGIAAEGEPNSQGPEARKKRRGSLRFGVSDGRLTGMPVLGLLYPCFTLAEEVDPKSWAAAGSSEARPALTDVLAKARAQCAALIGSLTASAPTHVEVDERWYWAAPILLDLERGAVEAKAWLGQADLAARWRGDDTEDDEEAAEASATTIDDAWATHVAEARAISGKAEGLGRPPADLADVLALVAIAGPAVSALRSLARVSGGLDRARDTILRNQAGQVAEGFRSLFNQPEVSVMLRRATPEEPYWQRVLEYCASGGLQAVLDEYAHVLVESLGVSGHPAEEIQVAVGRAVRGALTLRTASVAADIIDVDTETKTVSLREKMRFRTRFAVRYGARSQEQVKEVQRAVDVQKAFNSPFWPFVLCSTSVGQEGLDFHLYCHAVMHWNLPSNPVDLEQREGRIHRYKGHAIRKNVARDFGQGTTHARSGIEADAWHQIFEAARRARHMDASDLVPFWVYTTEGGAHIERHLPLIPLSKDVDRAEALRRSVAIYRMAFGQSRQEDLVEYLQRYLSAEQIAEAVAELRIDLSPEPSAHRHNSGVVQSPGELVGNDDGSVVPESAYGLAELEMLLDRFAALRSHRTPAAMRCAGFTSLLDAYSAVRPVPRLVGLDVFVRLMDEFTAIRRHGN